MRKAFTMIELIFVIVILGVLAAIALPRINATRDDAVASKMSATIATIVGEIAASYVSKPPYDVNMTELNLSDMSNNLAMLEKDRMASIDTNEKKAFIKVGEDDKCLIFVVESGLNEENLSVLTDSNAKEKLCKDIQIIIKEQHYEILLRGSHVKF